MYLKDTIADGYDRIGRVMSAYNDDKLYSVELVGAVCSVHTPIRGIMI